jgi:hypothetical protein
MELSQQLSSVRVNLMLPLDTSIQIEKEIEKRGIHRAQFIKEAIHEKLKRIDSKEIEHEINSLKEEVKEIKYLMLSALDKLQKKV